MQDMNAVFGPFEIAIECNRNVHTIPNLQMMFQLKWVFSWACHMGYLSAAAFGTFDQPQALKSGGSVSIFLDVLPGTPRPQASQNTWWDSVHSRCNIEIPLGLHLVPDPKVPCGHCFEINGIYCNAPPQIAGRIYIIIYLNNMFFLWFYANPSLLIAIPIGDQGGI